VIIPSFPQSGSGPILVSGVVIDDGDGPLGSGVGIVLEFVVLGIREMDAGVDLMMGGDLILVGDEVMPLKGISCQGGAGHGELDAEAHLDGGVDHGVVPEDLLFPVGILGISRRPEAKSLAVERYYSFVVPHRMFPGLPGSSFSHRCVGRLDRGISDSRVLCDGVTSPGTMVFPSGIANTNSADRAGAGIRIFTLSRAQDPVATGCASCQPGSCDKRFSSISPSHTANSFPNCGKVTCPRSSLGAS